MKKFVLIGHRGVGKTELLNELKIRFQEMVFASLDELIVEETKQSIDALFTNSGEVAFRELETKVFAQFLKRHRDQSFVVDLGAGFLGDIPEDVSALWIKRKIDSSQSRFLNRPCLDRSLTMSEARFKEREKRYSQRADFTIELREGPFSMGSGEEKLFRVLLEGGSFDLLGRYHFTLTDQTTDLEKETLKALGLKGFEWRDDLAKEKPMQREADLTSLRSNQNRVPETKLWDWPLEWGDNENAPLLSLHTRPQNLQSCFSLFPKREVIKKLAIPIDNFAALKMGHEWMMESPRDRAFLPMSEEGKWSWFRQWMSASLPINFLRLSQGSAVDQPSLLQILNQPAQAKFFAAVLGSPVQHSYTPKFHQDYFQKKSAPVFAIDVSDDEFTEALDFLKSLGLRWAAVTAPLKMKAAELLKSSEPINTLVYKDSQWEGANTDEFGFAKATESIKQESVAIWGGGGTHRSLLKRFPLATIYSSRTGEKKHGKSELAPEILIWGVGAENFARQGVMPPHDWSIQKVIDLNYTQNSPGIDCAHQYGCQYQSGLVMFEEQAKKQQEFWDEFGIQ